MHLPSWLHLHGATTHFPIALLFVALLADVVGAVQGREPEKENFWQKCSLFLLGLSFAGCLVGLLTGYYTGQSFARLPPDFQTHWIFAVVATVLSGVLFLWRIGLRDKLPMAARVVALAILLIATGAVGYTGYLGGEMVLGDDQAGASVEPTPVAAAPDPNQDEKVALAAEKMELAAGRLDLATDRMAAHAEGKPAPATPKFVVKAAPPQTVNTSGLDRAADTLNRVADKYAAIATKLEQTANKMDKTGGAKAATDPAAASPTPGKPAAAPTPAVNTALIAEGEKLYWNDDIGCAGCHKLNGKGGRGGPDLTHAGQSQPDIAWQKAHLIKPDSKVPGSKMPAYNDLSDAQVTALANFLASLK